MLQPIRHQLPVYSPTSLRALLQAWAAADARLALADQLAQRYRAARVELLESGTAALQTAIGCATRRRTDAVVALPAFSCYDLATAAVGAGCRITLYDVDPATLLPELDSFARALRQGAAAAVVASLYGFPPPWEALRALTDRAGAVLIEDAAQGHGASWQGRELGSFGDLAVLSFGRGKGWTGGGGGALLLRGAFAEAVLPPRRSSGTLADLSLAARYAAQWAIGRPAIYRIPRAVPGLGLGETHYRAPTEPRPIAGTSAALLLATREAAAAEARHRLRAAAAYGRAFHDAPTGTVPPLPGAQPGFLRFPLRVRDAAAVAQLRLLQRLGVARSYPTSLADLPAVRARCSAAAEGFPGARQLVRELITLPTHSRLSAGEQAAIISLLGGSRPAPARDVAALVAAPGDS